MPEEVLTLDNVHQGHNIKKIRIARGMKQDTLARKLNISQQTVSNREDQRTLEEDFIDKCAEVLEVTADLIKKMPDDQSLQSQYFTNTRATSNKNAAIGFNTVTNYFCDEESIALMKENMTYLRNEIKELRQDNEELKKEIELLSSNERATK